MQLRDFGATTVAAAGQEEIFQHRLNLAVVTDFTGVTIIDHTIAIARRHRVDVLFRTSGGKVRHVDVEHATFRGTGDTINDRRIFHHA